MIAPNLGKVVTLPFVLSGSEEFPFSLQKKEITREHRQQCLSAMEKIFGDGPIMEDDFIVINFFALVCITQNLEEQFRIWSTDATMRLRH